MRNAAKWTDRDVEGIIGTLLRVGVVLAAAVVMTGGIIYITHHGFERADYRVFNGEPRDLKEVHGIFRQAVHFEGLGIIQFGLLLLIATPIVRVAFSMVGFAIERDRMYVGFTLIVFAVLIYSMVGA
jgi:uncharacterized membrane protein